MSIEIRVKAKKGTTFTIRLSDYPDTIKAIKTPIIAPVTIPINKRQNRNIKLKKNITSHPTYPSNNVTQPAGHPYTGCPFGQALRASPLGVRATKQPFDKPRNSDHHGLPTNPWGNCQYTGRTTAPPQLAFHRANVRPSCSGDRPKSRYFKTKQTERRERRFRNEQRGSAKPTGNGSIRWPPKFGHAEFI